MVKRLVKGLLTLWLVVDCWLGDLEEFVNEGVDRGVVFGVGSNGGNEPVLLKVE